MHSKQHFRVLRMIFKRVDSLLHTKNNESLKCWYDCEEWVERQVGMDLGGNEFPDIC